MQQEAHQAIVNSIMRETIQEQILMAGSARRAKDAEGALTSARIPEAKARGQLATDFGSMLHDGASTINSAKSWAADHLGGYAADLEDWFSQAVPYGSFSKKLREYGKRK